MSEKWCGESIPRWSQGQWQKMNTPPLTVESWLSELPCWGIFWYLSDPGKNLPPLPPCSPSGEFFWPPSSLHTRGHTVSSSSLIFHIFSSELANKKTAKQVPWQGKSGVRFLIPCRVWLTEKGWSPVFGPWVVPRDSGVKVQPIFQKIAFWTSNHPSPCLHFPLISLLWQFACWILL